jgi:hypothetical protein
MLVKLSCAYDGTFGELKVIDGDDYETTLDWHAAQSAPRLKNTKKVWRGVLDRT